MLVIYMVRFKPYTTSINISEMISLLKSKSKLKFLVCKFVLVVLIFSWSVGVAVELDQIITLAETLYANKDFYNAIAEYKCLYFFGSDDNKSRLHSAKRLARWFSRTIDSLLSKKNCLANVLHLLQKFSRL